MLYFNHPIIQAIIKGDLEKLKKIFPRKDVYINQKLFDNNGLETTALMLALKTEKAKEPDINIIKYLLENGADPNLAAKANFLPLHLASCGNNTDILNLLTKSGAKKEAYCKITNSTWVKGEWNPLHIAAYSKADNSSEICRSLLNLKADINARTNDERQLTPLMICAKTKSSFILEKLKIFIEAKADINAVDSEGRTALTYFILHSNDNNIEEKDEIIKLFIAHGARLDIKDKSNFISLGYLNLAERIKYEDYRKEQELSNDSWVLV